MPEPDEALSLYSSESYRTDTGTRFNPIIEFFIYVFRLKRKGDIKRYIERGSILDIGCGRGLFLHIMKKDGWGTAGVEVNKETAFYASEMYGLNVAVGEPSNWNFPNESFDVITINHVLEHVHKPAEYIKKCKELLKKEGLLFIAVPNISSLQAVVGKELWFHLDVPYHINHFSTAGLLDLLKNNSFKILDIRHFNLEYNPFGWLQTLLNFSGIEKNLFYNSLKNPKIRKTIRLRKGKILLTLALLPLFIPISFILSVAETILKRGGTIEVFAIKE
ncbi:MAG: class I SAM-dependent methyltransferase [Nanoarchaeota archaeon]|nr:class I SAM-dependent methyltransferase [Nanoarchaeota archaeon]